MRKRPKISKHGWTADIISPFNFVCKNFMISGKYESVHGHNWSIYTEGKKKPVRLGIQLCEDNANGMIFSFNGDHRVNNEF